MECYADQAVNNNVIGTANVAQATLAYGVSLFVLISVDKAINLTSVYGVTKFAVVRCGNVIRSKRSIIPKL